MTDPPELTEAVRQAVEELDAEHGPIWASFAMKLRGKEPVGCAVCWPRDGHWPCTTRMIADDLRSLVGVSTPEDET